jgi:predicted nucleotidyltransferase
MAESVVWADTPFPLDDALLLAGWRGSTAHGTYIPPSDPMSIDDKDVMAIVIPPVPWYLGTRQWHEANAIKGEWDTVVYELRFYVSLLCKQNPNVLSLLWLREEDYLHVSPLGRILLGHRHLFRSRDQAYATFMGYANGQLKRMTRVAGQGYLGEKRKGIVEKFGYDVKNAAHLVRLLHMGIEYLKTGEMRVYRTWDQEMLKEIKRGGWAFERVVRYAEDRFSECKSIVAESPLPLAIDRDKVDLLVTYLVRSHLKLGGITNG